MATEMGARGGRCIRPLQIAQRGRARWSWGFIQSSLASVPPDMHTNQEGDEGIEVFAANFSLIAKHVVCGLPALGCWLCVVQECMTRPDWSSNFFSMVETASSGLFVLGRPAGTCTQICALG